VIADKFVDLYARNSGVRDKLVAERDVVLTYALRALEDSGVTKHLAFKGGTCLRKTVFGSTGRSRRISISPWILTEPRLCADDPIRSVTMAMCSAARIRLDSWCAVFVTGGAES
jgi:hypothetical protein